MIVFRATVWTALLTAATLAAFPASAADKSDKPDPTATTYSGPKTASPSKLAFIDITVISEKYTAYKQAKADLEKRQNQAKQQVKSLEDRITKLQEDFKAKESLLTDKKKKEMQDQYDQLLQEYQRTGRQKTQELMQMEQEATQQILTEIKSTVKALAVQKNYDMVVDKNSVVYGADDLGVRFGDDITEEVVKILNKK